MNTEENKILTENCLGIWELDCGEHKSNILKIFWGISGESPSLQHARWSEKQPQYSETREIRDIF